MTYRSTKSVIVTGASRGIGCAVVIRLYYFSYLGSNIYAHWPLKGFYGFFRQNFQVQYIRNKITRARTIRQLGKSKIHQWLPLYPTFMTVVG